jgi:hypothetical protein
MFASHSASADLKKLGVFAKPPTKAMLDSAEAKKTELAQATLDAAGEFAVNDIRAAAAAAVKEWAGTASADLDEGESMADRLIAMAVGIADENKDGEITEDESEVINIALNAMADFLIEKGADEADVVALLESADAEAGDRVAELVKGDGADEDNADVDAFTFDAESSESVMDSVLAGVSSGDAKLDAVYKKKMVIRAGKKVRINKRVSGHVRLSAGQKVAIRKAGLKSRSSSARMHRMKSMKIRRRAGL